MVGFGTAAAQGAGFAATSGGVGQICLTEAGVLLAASADGRQVGRMGIGGGAPAVFTPGPADGPPGPPALVALGDGVALAQRGADHLLLLGQEGAGFGVPRVLELGGARVAGPVAALPDGRLAVATLAGEVAIVDPAAGVQILLPVLAQTTHAEWQQAGGARGLTALAAEAGPDGASRLVAAVGGSDRIVAYDLGPDGSFAPAGQIGALEGATLAGPSDVALLARPGATLAIVAGQGSATLAVFEIDAEGSMRVRDQIMDTRELRLGGITAVRALEVGGTAFVLAGGAEAGLSLFALGPDARLYHLATTDAAPGASFGALADLELTTTGGGLRVHAARQGGAEVLTLDVDLSPLGIVGGTLMAETLRGTARDDILIARPEARHLSGGVGADLFVFGPGAADAGGFLGTVGDFEPGVDRLDLSGFPLVYGTAGVEIIPTAGGARLRVGGAWLELHTAQGGPLDPALLTDRDIVEGLHLPYVAAVAPPSFEPGGPSGWVPTVPGPMLPEPPHRGLALFAFEAQGAPPWGAADYADWAGFAPAPLAPAEAQAVAAHFALLF